MKTEYGNHQKIEKSNDIESICINFSPRNTSLQQRWKNNGLSADFMGDYVISFFPITKNDASSRRKQEEIKSSVSYISNEMLENSMKYYNSVSDIKISLTLFLLKDKIFFELFNSINENQRKDYISFINKLSSVAPSELYFQVLEENAINDKSGGLGCLTIINDYNADFSWLFDGVDKNKLTVTTQIILPI